MSRLRTVEPPCQLNLIALERPLQFGILRHYPHQRKGQVIAQRDGRFGGLFLPAPRPLDLINLLVVFRRFPRENLQILDGRRLERLKTITAVSLFNRLKNAATGKEFSRQKITSAAKGAWSDNRQVLYISMDYVLVRISSEIRITLPNQENEKPSLNYYHAKYNKENQGGEDSGGVP